MRVGMYYRNDDVRVQELPVPKIGPGEALVKVHASGICGSDVMEWYRIKKAPLVLGHEIAGEIVELGAGVTRYKPGDRVFVSHHVPCNTCRYCLRGDHTACETLHTTNFDPGGFSEYLRVPSLQTDRGIFVLPNEVSWDEGTFVEPLACVVRGQRVANLRPSDSVLVLGSGISGLMHIMLAKALGAGRILATDVADFRLDMAKDLGAEHTIRATDDVPARVKELNEGRGADLVIVCTGARPAFTQALNSVDRGGSVMFFAPTDPGVDLPVPVNDFWRNGIKLMPSYGAAPNDLAISTELIRSKRVPVARLVTHRLPLDQIGVGFMLTAKPQNSMKVVIEPQR
ncbi:MAG: zinc-dependent dehydrogenase [bacterium]